MQWLVSVEYFEYMSPNQLTFLSYCVANPCHFSFLDYPDSRPENIEEDMVELASFAVLPLIMTCGHEMVYDDLYNKLSTRNFDKSDIPSVTDAIHSHLNCLGLSCDDIGKHTSGYGISWYPECSDNLDIVGYVPINPTPTNMVSLINLLFHPPDRQTIFKSIC